MNRMIPIAGALAATLGSMVALAPAQAASTCYFDNLGGTLPGASCDGFTTDLGDKRFTVVSAPSSGVGSVEWTINPSSTIWQADIDWDGAGLEGAASGVFKYTAEIFTGGREFDLIGLGSDGFDPGAGTTTVAKTVYAGLEETGTPIAELSTTDGGDVYSAISGNKIFVTDSWDVPEGHTLDNVLNYHTQTVPGPLPVLGAVAALGFSRRMRRRLADANA